LGDVRALDDVHEQRPRRALCARGPRGGSAPTGCTNPPPSGNQLSTGPARLIKLRKDDTQKKQHKQTNDFLSIEGGLKRQSNSTDKEEKKIFLINKVIQSGAVAKSYLRKGFLIYEEMRKYLVLYEEA
jgi:hypothetical protein